MRVILHIGVHKTGTTSLQACLARNARQLLSRGIYYRPEGKGQTSHYFIVRKFSKEETDIKGGKIALKNLLNDADRSGAHTLLVSCEMLCEQRVEIEPFLSVFASNQVTAIAYMRRPDDLVISAYNQVVRDGNHRRTLPLSERHKAYDPSYKLILSRWMRPDVPLLLAPYDQKQWVGGKLETDFLSMIGLADCSSFDLERREEDSNVSLPSSLIDVLRLANRIEMSRENHSSFVRALYQLYQERQGAFLSYDVLTLEQRYALRRELADVISLYRPYFRPGFDEAFLVDTSDYERQASE